ncbi:hypothetical protein [Oricola sp.]|uniref:hypothetical protein n=1 Tax=Oricola sp. TaxID=1979950 RepID=UPI0025EF6829|nr:hypothetical protein [Oricola sp.]MCI5074036.1 hypothetical protein [Oricola sp.]
MADLIDIGADDLPVERRLRLSIRWRSIRTLFMFPDEACAYFSIGLFLGDQPLFNEAVYPDVDDEVSASTSKGYFKVYDDNCDLLTGLRDLLVANKRFDFEDFVEPLFRLIIAPDALDAADKVTSDTDDFDVLAIIYSGGNWHGQALGDTGPAVRLRVARNDIAAFFRELLDEALDPDVCAEDSRQILRQRFKDDLANRPETASGMPL